jgi:hypothetical protein
MGRAKFSGPIKGFPDKIELKRERGGSWISDEFSSSVSVKTSVPSDIVLKLTIKDDPRITFDNGSSTKKIGRRNIDGKDTFEFTWKIKEAMPLKPLEASLITIITRDQAPPNEERTWDHYIIIIKKKQEEA